MSYLSFDECAIAISLIFLVSYIVRKQYRGGRSNFIMFLIIIMILVSTVMDLGSESVEYYGVNGGQAMRTMTYVYNLVYFITRNLIAPLFVLYLYSSIDIWHIFKNSRLYRTQTWIHSYP